MKKLKTCTYNGTTTIKWRYLFLVICLCFAIGCYIFAPIPLGIFVIAVIAGMIDFPITAWCWRNPKGIRSYCIQTPLVIAIVIALDVFAEDDYGIFTYGHNLVSFFSLIASTFFLLVIVFKNSLIRYLDRK
jgi:hypothetical protein